MTLDENYKRFKISYNFACHSVAISFIIYWIYHYYLNEDLCLVDYKNYYEDPLDVHPVLSLCFNVKYLVSEEKLHTLYPRANITNYVDFLMGNNFTSELININYKKVIIDINEYIADEYTCRMKEGCSLLDSMNQTRKIFSIGFSVIDYSTVSFGCFTLQPPQDSQWMIAYGVLLKTSIWPNKNRPPNVGMFSFLHYPNQFLLSLNTLRMSWPKRDRYDSLEMVFKVQGVEVIKRRIKQSNSCEEEWQNYDQIILEEKIRLAGCRASYQNPRTEYPLCNSSHQMNKLRFQLTGAKTTYRPPCKAMEKIYYDYKDSIFEDDSLWAKKDHFYVGPGIPDPQFKEILQTRKVDIQGLIGYIGGYIGLCLGYSFLQLPDFILQIVRNIKHFYSKVSKNSKTSRIKVTSQKIDISNQNDTEHSKYHTKETGDLLRLFETELSKLKDQMYEHTLILNKLQDKL